MVPMSSATHSEDWTLRKVSEVAEVVGGGTPSTMIADNFGGDLAWITPKDLSGHQQRIILRGARSLSNQGLSSSSAKRLPPGTVIVSTRAPIGLTAIAGQEVSTNQGCRSLIPKAGVVDSTFLYYLMTSSTDYLHQHANGTTFQELAGGVFRELTFLFPPLAEQVKIAEVLSTIDDLIDNKRQLLLTLDAALNAAGGAALETSVELITVPLSSVATFINGYSYKSSELVDESDTALVNLKNFGREGGFRLDGLKPFDGGPKDSQFVVAGDVLVAKTDLTQGAEVVGRCVRMPSIPAFSAYVASLDVAIIRPKGQLQRAGLLALLSQDDFRDHCLGHANGTTVLHLSKEALPSYQISLPDAAATKVLVQRVQALTAQQDQTLRDLYSLSELRTFLLPRLLSGDLRVGERKEAQEEVL